MNIITTDHAGTVSYTRLLREGYGEGAWHGPDLKEAVADVTPAAAFWQPAPERHSIAEIVLHHASTARTVRAKLTGTGAEPFVLDALLPMCAASQERCKTVAAFALHAPM